MSNSSLYIPKNALEVVCFGIEEDLQCDPKLLATATTAVLDELKAACGPLEDELLVVAANSAIVLTSDTVQVGVSVQGSVGAFWIVQSAGCNIHRAELSAREVCRRLENLSLTHFGELLIRLPNREGEEPMYKTVGLSHAR